MFYTIGNIELSGQKNNELKKKDNYSDTNTEKYLSMQNELRLYQQKTKAIERIPLR